MNPNKLLKVVISSSRQQFVVKDQRTRLWRGVRGRTRRQASPSQGGRLYQFPPYAILDYPPFRIAWFLYFFSILYPSLCLLRMQPMSMLVVHCRKAITMEVKLDIIKRSEKWETPSNIGKALDFGRYIVVVYHSVLYY